MEQSLHYVGEVTIKLNINGKESIIKKYNTGTQALGQSLCKYLSGNFIDIYSNREYYTPKNLDLLWKNGVDTITYLSYMQPLSAPEYLESDDDLPLQVTTLSESYRPASVKFTGVINYSNLIAPIQPTTAGRFFLALKSSLVNGEAQDLAYIEVSTADLSKLSPGTNAIVEWKMYFSERGSN